MPQKKKSSVKNMTLDEKIELLSRGFSVKRCGCGDFPDAIGLAAAFDPEVMFSFGKYSAARARAEGEICAVSPSAAPTGDPRGCSDCLGEDPLLSGRMSEAFLKGAHGSGEKANAIPVLDGFFMNDFPWKNVSIPRQLRPDYYSKPFEIAMKSGYGGGVYVSGGTVNGDEICGPGISLICKYLGALFTAADGKRLAKNSDYADDLARIFRLQAANIVLDDPDVLRSALKEALEVGKLSEDDLDKAVSGLLEAEALLAKDCEPFTDSSAALNASEKSIVLLRNKALALPFGKHEPISVIGCLADMHFEGSSSTILDSIVALAGRENVIYEPGNDVIAIRNAATGFYFAVNNDGVLVCNAPLISERCLFAFYDWGGGRFSLKSQFNDKFICRGETMACGAGEPYIFTLEKRESDCLIKHEKSGYMSITRDGEISASGKLKPPKNSLFHIEIFSSGVDRVTRAVTEAHNVAVFCGNHPRLEKSGLMTLPEKQREIADEVIKLNGNAALFLITERPVFISPKYDTVIQMPRGGSAMSTAAARALFGYFSPAGRCPVTWYASEEDLCSETDGNIIRGETTYRYFNGTALFPFGHGLSYTTFRYGAMKLNKAEFSEGDTIEVTFEVANTGNFASDEVVQLYSVTPRFYRSVPKKELRAFKRIHIPAGERTVVKLSFGAVDLAMWDPNTAKSTLYSGEYILQAGCSSADIMRTRDFRINGTAYVGLDVKKEISVPISCDYIGAEFRTDSGCQEYALIEEGGSLIFENCVLNGESKLEITAANPSSAVNLSVIRTDINAVVAAVEIPFTGGLERFVTVSAELCRIDGICDLKFAADGVLALKTFKGR